MSRTDPDEGPTDAPAASDGHVAPGPAVAPSRESRQQCAAYADSTGERCQRDALPRIPYCGTHKHLLDDVDRGRLGLKPPKSGG